MSMTAATMIPPAPESGTRLSCPPPTAAPCSPAVHEPTVVDYDLIADNGIRLFVDRSRPASVRLEGLTNAVSALSSALELKGLSRSERRRLRGWLDCARGALKSQVDGMDMWTDDLAHRIAWEP